MNAIGFSDFSIPSLEAGIKTQTRRPIRWQAGANGRKLVRVIGKPKTHIVLDDRLGLVWSPWAGAQEPWPTDQIAEVCRYGGPGSRLWVREAWRTHEREDGVDGILFRAGNAFVRIQNTRAAADAWVEAHDNDKHGESWRSPIFMPRWASRFLIELVEVTAQRVQAISEADALAEGVRELPLQEGQPGAWWTIDVSAGPALHARTPVAAYAKAWDMLHGHGAWTRNDWVWRLVFKVVTDAPAAAKVGG